MILFLLTILLLYGSLHLYIVFQIRAAFTLGPVGTLALVLLLAFMVCAPVIVRITETHGWGYAARLIAHMGYTWMGLAFLFFWFSLAIKSYHGLLVLGGSFLERDLAYLALSPRYALLIPCFTALAVTLYGTFEARHIRNETVIIRSPKIPRDLGVIRIAQISDVHLGLMVREKTLTRILRVIQAIEPDLLVSTGDLVDGQTDDMDGLADLLRTIQPRYGKFAVTGNHDFYAGLTKALDFTAKAGFSVLRGEARQVVGPIQIVGVDDPTGGYFGESPDINEQELLSSLPADHFTLLLKHQPEVNKNRFALFDLQLSGHTHKGQIFPFSLIVRLFIPHSHGLVPLPHHAFMYVSRGSGTWGPPIRFLSPPEVTAIELVHGDRTEATVRP
jgi:predicted MPP superfamily phosphohydrolase